MKNKTEYSYFFKIKYIFSKTYREPLRKQKKTVNKKTDLL